MSPAPSPSNLLHTEQARSDFDALAWVWIHDASLGPPSEPIQTYRQLAWIACCAFEAGHASPPWQHTGRRQAIIKQMALCAIELAGPEASTSKARLAMYHELRSEWMLDTAELDSDAQSSLFDGRSPVNQPADIPGTWSAPAYAASDLAPLMGELSSRLADATRSQGLFNASLGMSIALRGAIARAMPAWTATAEREELDRLAACPFSKKRLSL